MKLPDYVHAMTKVVRRSKRPEWSVYVVVEADMYEGRVLTRTKNKKTKKLRDMSNKPVRGTRDYMYLNAVKMYKKDGKLYIITMVGGTKETHIHNMDRVKGIWKREYKREGVQ